MNRLKKMYYYTSKGEKKLNCYYITIPKDIINKTDIIDKIQVSVKNNKIIIEKKKIA